MNSPRQLGIWCAGLVLVCLATVVSAETFEGELTDQQPKREHKVRLETGKVYQIDLISVAFDAYVRLNDAAGKEVGKDDDGGEGRNARLIFAPPSTGDYAAVADSFESTGRGGYLMHVKALPEIKVGQTVQGKITDKSSKLTKIVYESYIIKVVSPKTYKIDMMSKEIDSILAARFPGQVDSEAVNDDGGEGFNARLIFTPKKSGLYELRCGSYDGKLGAFTLTIVD